MTDVLRVSGVGPKAAERLAEANITTAEELAKATSQKLMDVGFTENRANKFITAATLLLESESTTEKPKKAPKAKKEVPVEEKKPKKAPKKDTIVEEEAEEEKEVKEEKPKKKSKKSKKDLREDQRSPSPKGIPTKKKRGVQVRIISEDEEASITRVEKKEGWGVVAKVLTEKEREEKRIRLEAMTRSAKITRPIPTKPEVVKGKKVKKAKSVKSEKKEKVKKVVKLKAKKVKKIIEYYSQDDLFPEKTGDRKRGVSAKSSGTSTPRITLERDTYLGMISSHRRSRRVINSSQVIVDLDVDVKPDSLVGQKVYFIYPDNKMKVPGSISKRFGKVSSGKVLVNFKKGIRTDGIHQKLFIK